MEWSDTKRIVEHGLECVFDMMMHIDTDAWNVGGVAIRMLPVEDVLRRQSRIGAVLRVLDKYADMVDSALELESVINLMTPEESREAHAILAVFVDLRDRVDGMYDAYCEERMSRLNRMSLTELYEAFRATVDTDMELAMEYRDKMSVLCCDAGFIQDNWRYRTQRGSPLPSVADRMQNYLFWDEWVTLLRTPTDIDQVLPNSLENSLYRRRYAVSILPHERVLAVVEGGHPRLGERSPLVVLDANLLASVALMSIEDLLS
jgi:hypothetical protein